MASSPMNRSLETKLAIFENMVQHVGTRPVIFTSRAEIWSRSRNPVIITSHPFPSQYIEFNRKATPEMMQHYRKLVAAKPTQHQYSLVLFEFRVRGCAEVHAIFSRRESPTQMPLPILRNYPSYFKSPDPTPVLIHQYPLEAEARTTVNLTAIDDPYPVPTSEPVVRSVDLMTTAESRLGPELCKNLEEKLRLFVDEVPSRSVDEAVTFTSVPHLWNLNVPLKVIKHPLPRIPPNDYDHFIFNIDEDILEYVAYVVKRNNYAPFCAYSRRFGEGWFADVHLLFARRKQLGPRSGISTISVSELSLREITDDCDHGSDEILPIANRLGDDFTRYLETYIPIFAGPHRNAPDVGHCYFLFRTNKENKADWDRFFSVVSLPPRLPQIPEHYYHGNHDVVQDVLEYMRLRHVWSKTAGPGLFHASVLRYQMEIATEVYIMPWGDEDLIFPEVGPVMRSLMAMIS